MLDLQ